MPEQPPTRPPTTVTVIKLAWCCLLASVVVAGLMFPVVGGFGLLSNRASDVVANGSAQLVEGEVPQVSTMVDAKGNVIAWLYSQRRFEVASDQIANTMKLAIVSIEDKRFAEHNGVDWQGTLTGLSGYLSGNLDTRGGSTIEQQYVKNYQLLVTAQSDDERRAALPMSGKTGTTESHRSSGFVGFTNQYAAANYIFADSSDPSGICSFPLRECGSGDLYGGNEPARTWFEAMKPIATDFGDVHLPPTDPRYVDGAPEGRVPSVSGLKVDAARQRLKDAGFQVADQTTSMNSSAPYGAVVGTTPSGQTIPGSIITINTSNGVPPAPPPRPVERPPVGEPVGPGPPPEGSIVEIPGLPPITVPLLGPPPPAELPPAPAEPPPPPPG